MTTRSFELYAAGHAPPELVWGRVRDPHRWPEWTDVTSVDTTGGTGGALAPGDVVTTVERSTVRWQVLTAAERLLEVGADLPRGRLELGARVVRPASGSRLVLAARFLPRSRAADLGFVLRGGPALRRRFDRWAQAAVQP